MNTHNLPLRVAGPLAALALISGQALTQDLVISQIGSSDGQDFIYYGEANGIAAYSFGTTSCNVGDVPIDWYDSPSTQHPMIAQNMFRVKDGRIEQIGQSWLKHGFCAWDDIGICGECPGGFQGCEELMVGCSDTYMAFMNDGKSGAPKYQIDATTGVVTLPAVSPSGDSVIRGRLQVEVDDIDPNFNPGATYIAEAQYTSEHDHMAGNSRNNVSLRFMSVQGVDSVSGALSTAMGEPAIFVWRFIHDDVLINEVVNANEGGPGVDSHIFIASRATQLPNGKYRYEYAIQNLDSDQAVGSFALPATCAYVQLEDFDQHHVGSHSGDPWGDDDWGASLHDGMLEWATTPFLNDPNASAIRWGTMANFSFTSNLPPKEAEATLGLFAPGVGSSLSTTVLAPCGTLECGRERYCEGVANSLGTVATMNTQGSMSVSQNNLILYCNSIPANQWGIFFYGPEELDHPLGGGTLCIGAAIYRINPAIQANNNGLAMTFVDLNSGPMGSGPGKITPGSSWNFQYWYRDPAGPTFSGFNFTDAMRIHFCQ
jgi:hypothetical protein